MNILMLYPKFPAETFWNAARSLHRFTGSLANMPPLGLLTLASYLPPDFCLRLIDRNCHDETDEDWRWADVVFLSAMMAQRDDYRVCVNRARAMGTRIAIGGPLTHAMRDVAAADADWVCVGEAESIVDQLVADVRADARGTVYEGGNRTDMTAVRPPRFDLLASLSDYTVMPLQFSRGCPFRCEFCDIIEIYGRVARTKQPRQILAELSLLVRSGFKGDVFIVDDNFIGNKRHAKALLKEMATWCREHGYPYRFYTEASLNLADDDELLRGMYDASFVSVFIGIETAQPRLLKGTLKMQNIPGDPLRKLEHIRQHGIHVMAGFIIGFDGEDHDVFEEQRTFIEASGIGAAMLGLLQASPHTQLSRRLEREGRLLPGRRPDGIFTVDGINFVPNGRVTRREYLEQFSALAEHLYQPEAFFRRILPALLALRYREKHLGLLKVWWKYWPMLLRLICAVGFRRNDARPFWNAMLRVLVKNPFALEAFGYDCFHYYYLHEHVAFVRKEMQQYLASPRHDDALDALAPEMVLHAAAR